MKICSWLAAFVFLLLTTSLYAQDDPPIEEEGEEEFVDYSSLVQTATNKAYCTSRIVGQVPTKLFSVGYDFQGSQTLGAGSFVTEGESTDSEISSVQGERLAVNYPVFSKNHLLVNLGLNYAVSRYNFKTPTTSANSPLAQALDNNGLRTFGLTATAFKPLNKRQYLIFQVGANLNGDYALGSPQGLEFTRYSAAVIYGIKASDRKMWGVGISRTYLGGALNYVPVYYMLYTAPNKKWGAEMLLPRRALYRRNLNAKNMLTVGWEVEGNTFRIDNEDNRYDLPYDDIELRRSELRFRATWERALTSQFWLSLQAGYRYNWSYDVDRGDFFRPFGDDTPFLAENDLTNPVYFNISINWVSP